MDFETDESNSPPGLREFVQGNGKILKDTLHRLIRFNGGVVLKNLQPTLKRYRFGPTPFEYDWDLLVVLDTCRPDALEEVAPEYDWLPNEIATMRSCASWSRSWMVKSFDPAEWGDEMAQTVHVSWNPFTGHVLEDDDWLLLDEVRNGSWDNDRGLIPPRVVTERAIAAHREWHPKRQIVHYMQPHAPYRTIESEPLHETEIGEIDAGRWTVWDRLKDADDPLDWDDAWDGMLDNLRWVLDDVEVLLGNIDAPNVLLTADHGEGFNEWFVYGHGPGMPFPKLITVPEVRLSATDTFKCQPDREPPTRSNPNVEDRLKALGYR